MKTLLNKSTTRGLLLLTLLCMFMLGVFSCSGDDPQDSDTIPPASPHLIPHLGNTGDNILVNNVPLSDENNGIDAVADGNWIKVPWQIFTDTDLSHVKVFRFSQANPTPIELGTIPAADEYYLDQSNDIVERNWYSYFIELYDASGNVSVSDTVDYAILAKCSLVSPSPMQTVSTDNLVLSWDRGDSDTSIFRVLVWIEHSDTNLELKYHYDYHLGEEPGTLWTPFPSLTPPLASGTKVRWRVDALDWDSEHGKYMGSESEERNFFIQ